ncbi:MAG: hypothetical protein F4X03_00290 [Dehalococcoidia bacterium]|nr:hypothetical protein [Dehalococcoidia bacterium]
MKGMVESAAISHSGQEMAAAVCSAGLCELGVGHPSADAVEHVWVSHNAGSTWSNAGEVLPGAWILEVTETDVLVQEWNLWGRRETLGSLTDSEWEEMWARLSHLVPGGREGWESRTRWIVSGEADVPPTAPSPPALGNVSWRPADRCSNGALPWTAEAQGDRLLALVDEEGAVRRVYGTSEPLWASAPGGTTIRETPSCAVREVLVQEIRSYDAGMQYTAGVALFDLESGSVHEVEGLSLPEGFDPEADGSQEEYYHFWTARPAPVIESTMRDPAIEFTPLTMGQPRALPVGFAFYFGVHSCEGVYDILRVVAGEDGSTPLVERPYAFFDEEPGYLQSFEWGPHGQRLAVLVCERGSCTSGHGPASDDAIRALWVSADGGLAWERWGEVPQGGWIARVSEEDVALEHFLASSEVERSVLGRVWWFRAGEAIGPPEGFDTDRFVGWRAVGGDGQDAVWSVRGEPGGFVTASGLRLASPPAMKDDAAERWWPVANSPHGALLWGMPWSDGADLFAITDGTGAVEGAYSWTGTGSPLNLTAFLGEELVVGALGPWDCGVPRTTSLVDLETLRVHPIVDIKRLVGTAILVDALALPPD